MKKLLICLALSLLLCTNVFALEKGDYGYCDLNHNGKVEFSEATSLLSDAINAESDAPSLLRVLYVLKAIVAGDTVAATVTSLDTEALTATVSCEYFENLVFPISVFGLGSDVSPADYSGVPAIITISAPAKDFASAYDGTANGIFAAEANLSLTDKPQNADRSILSMDDLNENAVNGSHQGDDINTASLVLNYREKAVLSSATTSNTRYDKAYYPRVKKINDNLYILLYMYSQTGQHLYFATSADGVNWDAPTVLWNSANYIINAENKERYFAMNAEAVALDDGSILCVFAVRDEKNYRTNPDGCGLAMIKGTVSEDNTVTWSDPVGIYTGQVWEPSILKRSDGQIHVYFTQVAPDIVEYGFDEDHRSTETGLIVSNDNGESWTPNIKPGDTNFYRATTVYREFVGIKGFRPHYNGQMPVAVELANGKIFLTVEVKTIEGKFRVSTAISNDGGEWKPLAKNEEGAYTKLTSTPNSSPYVDRFPSGEIYLTHNSGGILVGRLGTADASEFTSPFENAPGCLGIWGSCSVIGTHKAVTSMQNRISVENADGSETEKNEIHVFYHYLNHRINAKKIAVNVDGYRNEWTMNTDALFVGSASQAQAAVQVAHDKDNVYFLVNRLDYYLSTSDVSSVYVAASSNTYYRIDVSGTSKAYTVYFVDASQKESVVASGTTVYTVTNGTLNIDGNTDKGLLSEIAVPKSVLGLSGKNEMKMGVGITNVDKGVSISDTSVALTSTSAWQSVIFEK